MNSTDTLHENDVRCLTFRTSFYETHTYKVSEKFPLNSPEIVLHKSLNKKLDEG